MGEEEHGDDRWDYEVPEPEKPPTELENEEPEMDLEVLNRLSNTNIDYKSVGSLDETLDTTEIIDRVGGGDLTKGSCSSSAFCYIGNRAGYDVVDFRGGSSQTWFSLMGNIRDIGKLPNVISFVERHTNDFIATRNLLSNIKIGKEYYIATGRHAAMIRKTQNGFEFLELQTNGRNGWKELDDYILKRRFGCQ
jgi:hypothetical protein